MLCISWIIKCLSSMHGANMKIDSVCNVWLAGCCGVAVGVVGYLIVLFRIE